MLFASVLLIMPPTLSASKLIPAAAKETILDLRRNETQIARPGRMRLISFCSVLLYTLIFSKINYT